MSSWQANESYLGDGLYARLDEGHQIELRAPRLNGEHRVYLEPEVFIALIRFAHQIGWSSLVRRGIPKAFREAD